MATFGENNNRNTFALNFDNSKSFEDNVRNWCEVYQEKFEPGKGFFFDYTATPEFGRAIVNWMQHFYGWKLEYDGTFLRKPKDSSQKDED